MAPLLAISKCNISMLYKAGKEMFLSGVLSRLKDTIQTKEMPYQTLMLLLISLTQALAELTEDY